MEAAHRFSEVRPLLIDALNSEDSEVRSAAIAAFNEAIDVSAHDLVIALAEDSDVHFREEVLEYIEQSPIQTDAPYLPAKLESGEQLFLASSGLRRLCSGRGPLLTDDETADLPAVISEWRALLQELGYVV